MKGIHRTPYGYRAFVRVKGHPLKSKRFPADFDVEKIQLWRERERARLILQRDDWQSPAPDGPFRQNALLYLESVKSLSSYTDRVQHIFEWMVLFGEQQCDTIEPVQIRAQRDRWLTIGPRWRQRGKTRVAEARPLSASSVNHRLRALQNLFTVLWPGLPNPVKDVAEVEEPAPIPRALSPAHVEAALACVPPGKTKARLAVLRWTGFPARTLMRLTPADVDLERRVVYLLGRKKGKGTRSTALPLLPQAVTAFRQLTREDAWGHFSTSAMHSVLARACAAAKVPAFSPYQLRHTFGTEFLLATGDLRATQRALMHSTSKLTERYAQAAVDPAMAAAYKQMAGHHRRAKGRPHGSSKVTSRQKR